MKKMKTTIATAVALAACASTTLLAQNIKEDVITFALTVMQQKSVSMSPTVVNYGNFSQGPLYYSTQTMKLTDKNLMQAIAYVMHGGQYNFYTTQAKLVLVQGELGGFWNINDALAQSYEDFNQYMPWYVAGPTNKLTGSFNTEGTDTAFTTLGDPSGYPIFFPGNYANDLDTYYDNNSRISISDGPGTASGFDPQGGAYARLDTGRHFLTVPDGYATTGEYPVGHMQPWGQIYVKDIGHKDPSGNILCENVTFFFYLEVQECYDCFYLSSFISDAKFVVKAGSQSGPPCCTSPNLLIGKGTDKYYLSLSFDNTINNSYLNPALATNTTYAEDGSTIDNAGYYYEYVGVRGLNPAFGVADGITPDLLTYSDPIRSQLGRPSPYETRFTLNGIVTYNWNLTLINPTDVYADYVGTASYQANGYGFIGLVCSLITGSATFTERIVKDLNCCEDVPWYLDTTGYWGGKATGWYGPGSDDNDGYYDPSIDQWDLYPNFNIVGGYNYPTGTPQPHYSFDLPDQDESPFNPGAALTKHIITDATAAIH